MSTPTPIPPWEAEQAAAALAELKLVAPPSAAADVPVTTGVPGGVPSSDLRKPQPQDSSAAVSGNEPWIDPLALKKADAALLIQQVDKMIAERTADSAKLARLRSDEISTSDVIRILFKQYGLAIGMGLLLIIFVVMLYVMMGFIRNVGAGLTPPTELIERSESERSTAE